jgi:hypothetical protein
MKTVISIAAVKRRVGRGRLSLKERLVREEGARAARRWARMTTENPDYCHPDAEFSLSHYVVHAYGKPTMEDLSSEAGLIRYLVRFANGEEDQSEADAYVNLEIPPPGPWGSIDRHALASRNKFILELREKLGERRAEVCFLLDAVIEDRARAAERYLGNADREFESVSRLSGGRLIHRVVLADRKAFIAYVATLLLDKDEKKRPFGKNLLKCGWKPCGRFYLRKKGKPTLGCKADHGKKVHNADYERKVRLKAGIDPDAWEAAKKQARENLGRKDVRPAEVKRFVIRPPRRAVRLHK